MTNRTKNLINDIKTYQKEFISLNPDAVKIKFKKMSKSPFHFYRGTAHLFYADLKRYPSEFVNSKTGRVWIQGDLHIGNFGTYKDSNGRIVFDVNDYDECYLAPFVWDIWRAAVSIVLVARQQQLKDVSEKDFVLEYAKAFCEQIRKFSEDRSERDFKIDLENAQGEVKKALERAARSKRTDFLDRWTEIYRKTRRFKVSEKQISLSSEFRSQILAIFYGKIIPSIPLSKRHGHDYYSVQDIDMVEVKGAGIGSAGQKMFSFLIRGESDSPHDDIIISAKTAKPSVVMPYVVPNPFPDGYIKNDAMRCVSGQRAMQINADPFLSHFEYDGKSFYVSELSPYEESVELREVNSSKEFLSVLRQMGQATAKIHAISDRDVDELLMPYSADKEISNVIDGKEKRFLIEVCNFAVDYADIIENDHNIFLEAIKTKQII